MAELINYSPKAISKWENHGLTDINVLAQISEVLDFEIRIKKGKVYIIEEEENVIMKNTTNVKAEILRKYEEDYLNQIISAMPEEEVTEDTNQEAGKVLNSLCDGSNILMEFDNHKDIMIECKLYESEEYYLLDFRFFDNVDDNMLDAYLMIYSREDLSVYDEYVDDVWEFADWKLIK